MTGNVDINPKLSFYLAHLSFRVGQIKASLLRQYLEVMGAGGKEGGGAEYINA